MKIAKGSRLRLLQVRPIKLKTQILLLALVHMALSAISSSTPIKDFYPEEMEAGGKVLKRYEVQDFDTTTSFLHTYTVNLLRVHLLGSYILSVGNKGMDVNIRVEPASGTYFCLSDQNVYANSFEIILKLTNQNAWNFVRSSYIVISKTLGNVYDFFHVCTINNAMAAGRSESFTYSNSAIQPITSPYFAFVSIYMMDNIVHQSAEATRSVKVAMTQLSTTDYNITVSSVGFFIGDVRVSGLIIDSSLINNQKLGHVIMITDCSYSGAAALQSSIVYKLPGVDFWYQHAFFGLYHTVHSSKPNFDFYVHPIGQIQLTKQSESLTVGSYILVFYKQKCFAPTFLDTQTGACLLCPDRCVKCDSLQCFQCLNSFTISADRQSCVCPYSTVVTDVCVDTNTGPLKGCVLAVHTGGQALCITCSIPKFLIAKDQECTCKEGFKFDSDGNCFEYCGDGFTENHQCDDGNLFEGDGCSSSCTIEKGFKCIVSKTSTSCKSQIYLIFKMISIMKNEDNSAEMTFGVYQSGIPYMLQKQNFENVGGLQKKYSIKMQVEDGSYQEMNCLLQQVINNQLKFRTNYNFTVEGMNAKLYLDMSGTKYTMKQIDYQFRAIGDNEPLKFNGKLELFIGAERGYLGLSIAYFLLLLVGLIAPKYIGLQAILTLQLIYYSCLLVVDAEKFPVGFRSFNLLKLSTGYNDFFELTTLLLKNDLVSKLNFIGIKKLIVENYNASFFFIFVSGLAFGVSCLIRVSQESDLNQLKFADEQKKKQQIKEFAQKLKWNLKINENLFRAFNQISVWSILQVICAISAQLTIGSKSFILNEKNTLLLFGSLSCMIGTIFIIVVGMNQFKNILLSPITMQTLCERPNEIAYKQANFIYVILMGFSIFFLHEKYVWKIYPSAIATLIHLGYIVILSKINPYKMSLRVHSVGLFINQIIYLIFLAFVNMINYFDQIDQIISLGFVYFILFLCIVILILTIVRLYYEYRYGQKLELQILRQREEQERKKQIKEENFLINRKKALEMQAKQKLDEKIKKRLKNKYLYENQILDQQMNDQISFWDRRPNLKQEHKESEYFKNYPQKPLNWLKINEPQEYEKRLLEQEKIKMLQRQKINSKYEDPEYQRVSTRLRKQFARKTKKQKSSKKKKESSRSSKKQGQSNKN